MLTINNSLRSSLTLRINSLIFLLLLGTATTYPWGSTGHHIINRKAPMHLPVSMSTFRADSLFYESHASDADGRKNYSDTSFFAEAERHYIDIDWYPNFHSLPHNADSVIAMYGRTTVHDQGTQPWAEMMVLDSLTEQLRRGDLTTAKQTFADLGHYVADAHQPLHCTQNYDGGMTGNNGIHSRYETSMINSYQSSIVIIPDSVHYIANPLEYIFAFIYHSNSYTDSIMAADNYAKTASGWNGSGSPPSSYYTALWSKVQGFTKDQFQRATVALASLWYTAWVNSQTYSINAMAIGGGTITPLGTVLVINGNDTTFSFSPSTGRHIDSVIVDGINQGSIPNYTFTNVTAAHTITAYFSINTYSITVTGETNGTISPNSSVTVDYGGSKTFSISPNNGYHIDSLIIDNIPIVPDTTYTFVNVTASHSIRASFAINTYSITSNAGTNGEIFPSGTITANFGESKSFSITPDTGYHIDSVIVDGVFVGIPASYTFSNVTANHSIQIIFSNTYSRTLSVNGKWNLVSLPMSFSDYAKSTLYPTASSNAFAFDGGYVNSDTLKNGAGYWLKFTNAQTIPLAGTSFLTSDTMDVVEGWNLVGSISYPIAVTSISSPQGDIVTSNFFGYANGYQFADTIQPGKGYWVKVNQNGQLILASGGSIPARNHIKIPPNNELPPSPPGENGMHLYSDAPQRVSPRSELSEPV